MNVPFRNPELNPLFLYQNMSSRPTTENDSVLTLEIHCTSGEQLREVCPSSRTKRRLKEPEARQIQIQMTMYIFNTESYYPL